MPKQTSQTAAIENKDWARIAYNSLAHPINQNAYNRNKTDWAVVAGMLHETMGDRLIWPKRGNIEQLNANLGKALQKGATADPLVLNKNDITCNILGRDVKFKVDTGAKVSTLDAVDIQWNRGSDAEKVNEAWTLNSSTFAERSTLFFDHLVDLPQAYHNISFGQVESFKMITNKDGTEGELIQTPHEVVGVSWPKRSDGKKDESPRPVINLLVENNPIITDLNVSLVARPGMAMRGLFSEKDIAKNGLAIVLDKRDTTIIDFSKVSAKKILLAFDHTL